MQFQMVLLDQPVQRWGMTGLGRMWLMERASWRVPHLSPFPTQQMASVKEMSTVNLKRSVFYNEMDAGRTMPKTKGNN
ncbi:hypothetical protein UPYG_G00253580 [Umbra pygmaea]|uniref:Uncharacterized protein n=1 Tax=Umbra pygmaea TaxID=75934 RepID=A0ABD0WXZ9_UMBPY